MSSESKQLPYVAVAVAAQSAGVRREYVYRWARDGKIPSVSYQAKPNGKRSVLVLVEDVLAYKTSIQSVG